ncbi:MAG: hypothetical protein ACQES4_02270 [Bacillota bacterium]
MAAKKEKTKKEKPRNIKNQRWAGIIAAILALGMIVSLVGAYITQAVGGGGSALPDQQAEPEPEDYLNYYEGEVERLESYLEDNEATEAVLLELAENYRYLSIVQQVYFDEQGAVEEYEERMISLFQSLVDIEPDNPAYRIELINLYLEQQVGDELIMEQVELTRDLLHDNPDPKLHLSLVQLLSTAGEKELVEEEATWLQEHMAPRIASGQADNEERFYYAVLLGEYRGEITAARDILEDILEEESENSTVYQNALTYLEYFSTDKNEQDIIFE